VGVYAYSARKTGKWVCVDIDAHTDKVDTTQNREVAITIYHRLAELGFAPLLYSSDGRGGYHLWVLLSAFVPVERLHSFGQWLAGLAVPDLGQRPEAFPKNSGKTTWGHWVRVLGRHPRSGAYPEVYTGTDWVTDAQAIAHVLSLAGDDPSLIPAEVQPPASKAASARVPSSGADRAHSEKSDQAIIDSLTPSWKIGYRHQLALAVAGALATEDVPRERIEKIIRGVCAAADDNEVDDRVACVESTFERLAAHESVVGWCGLAKLIGATGDDVTHAIRASLGRPERAEQSTSRKASAADILIEIGREGAELWHTPDQMAYITVPDGRSYRVHSQAFEHYLTARYYSLTQKGCQCEPMTTALAALEAEAIHRGKQYPVHVRVGRHEDRHYLDLADDGNTVIEIDAQGWRVCERCPIRFRRPHGMLPLPMPTHGGSVDVLRRFANVSDSESLAMVLAWLERALLSSGPYPILVLQGEPGSSKSTTTRMLKTCIDPQKAPLRPFTRDERDLMIVADTSHVLAFDNISRLTEDESDRLCRLASGTGFATRTLYQNDEVTMFEAARPMILNGIEDFVTRGDMLERSIITRHPRILPAHRCTEREYWAGFHSEHPALLGALLTRISGGLGQSQVALTETPRMADFAQFAVACEAGAGSARIFERAYAAARASASAQALDSSPLPGAIVAMLGSRMEWRGTATKLLNALEIYAPNPLPRGWPKAPNSLTSTLCRLTREMRDTYRIDIDCSQRASTSDRARCVVITRLPVGPQVVPHEYAI
jgi:hypothetical protein